MRFMPLLEVRTIHGYYTSGRCPDLVIEPTAEALAVVRRHRLILKPYRGGLRVFAAVFPDGSLRLPIGSDTSAAFTLRSTSARLPQLTDLSAHEGMISPLYQDSSLTPGAGGTLALVDDPGRVLEPGAFAALELSGLDAVVPGTSAPVFEVVLGPKATRWTYYVVTDAVSEALTVVDADPSDDSAPIEFDVNNNPRDLAVQPDPHDPVAVLLEERYPGLRRMRFTTSEPVSLREAPRAWLELRVDGLRQAGALPNPSSMDRTIVDAATGLEPSLYRLIKHITQSSYPL